MDEEPPGRRKLVIFSVQSGGPLRSRASSCVHVRVCPRGCVTHPSECVTLLSRSTCPVAHPGSVAALACLWESRKKREALRNLFITDLKRPSPSGASFSGFFFDISGDACELSAFLPNLEETADRSRVQPNKHPTGPQRSRQTKGFRQL